MKVTIVNRSSFSDESLRGIVDFLEPCYADVSMPVRLTFVGKPHGHGTWGKAYWPVRHDRKFIKRGEYSVRIYIGGRNEGRYPLKWTYKKRAGPNIAHSLAEEIFSTTAHEMRHVEQFEACKRAKKLIAVYHFGTFFNKWVRSGEAGYRANSEEVDAELVARALLEGWRTALLMRIEDRKSVA